MNGVPFHEWDRQSRHYDRQLWLERSAVRSAVDLLAPTRDERMLDVATGTGEVLRQLARRRERPREVVAVDASAAMLAHVGALPAGWSVRIGDARWLPLADASSTWQARHTRCMSWRTLICRSYWPSCSACCARAGGWSR